MSLCTCARIVDFFPIFIYAEHSEDHQNEKKQKLFIQSLLQPGSQSSPLVFGRDSKTGRGMFWSRKKGRLQVCPDWRLLTQGNQSCTNHTPGILCDCLKKGNIFGFLSLVPSWRSWQSLTKSWPFWADCYRSCGLASGAGGHRGCGSEFSCHRWSGHFSFTYSVS